MCLPTLQYISTVRTPGRAVAEQTAHKILTTLYGHKRWSQSVMEKRFSELFSKEEEEEDKWQWIYFG